jgi:NAD(P)-dependent dehydrogenase (short-subunit alcohol dehydrogenase family)
MTTSITAATRVVVVTGAGQGTGLAIANRLADESTAVALVDINRDAVTAAAADLGAAGFVASGHACDVSDEQQVAETVETILAAYGGVDVLINVAAYLDPSESVIEMRTETWRRSFGVNVDGTFFFTRACAPSMVQRGGGVIVNFSSLNGTRGFPNRASYAASKAAVITFSQTAAMELREHGIRVNCIVPGGIDGERVRALRARRLEGASESIPQAGHGAPPWDLLTPEWIASYVAYLVSDDSAPINGQALVIGEVPRSPLQAVFPDL